ncbi:hypothetical protein P170DRAFT_511401 [Aspergillus steynii IBT 23096]|uniref:Ras guanyl-nucleotide exchange factor RasGEF n=1 Tax=Aspergillus steynii IBT 23096 TaxID=1392250 RepID=A0A2I2G1F4_9EURO|nr:uncharacterized protein P170DRAFT_511401 [Aspergillus steynii IBT 23096]PLB46714.1 hypothetical protein P170DRAFT_511401 [Aspergillus steynii IBT 23096]
MNKTTSTYRALLRELPRRKLSSPTPLHQRIRALYRTPVTPGTETQTHDEALHHRLQEAEQMALYARAQRSYAVLVERYNPGMTMDEKERIRLTARRVGWDLPVEAEGEGEAEGEKK